MSDRLPLRVPARCPIFSRNWASSLAPPTPPPAAARLGPSGRLRPEHSRAAQQEPSLRQRQKRHERSSHSPRAYTMPNFLRNQEPGDIFRASAHAALLAASYDPGQAVPLGSLLPAWKRRLVRLAAAASNTTSARKVVFGLHA
eukprot:scaffold56463_cov68-Phaeocystis_antarctica.AAC.1